VHVRLSQDDQGNAEKDIPDPQVLEEAAQLDLPFRFINLVAVMPGFFKFACW
jgi:hypothetical protein